MTRRSVGLALLVLIAASTTGFVAGQATAQKQDDRVYELRTYTTLPGRLPALEQRFAKHTMQLFQKHGMRNEMYWIPTDSVLRTNTLIYVISHDSREAADRNWREFGADPQWIAVRDASEKDGKILARSPDRVFMQATDWSPRR
jgi:hypothetical protein